MKKYIILALFFGALCLNVFSQKSYPFNVKVSGNGERTLIFIPGFASSGDVWNETVKMLEPKYKCIVLTMPGFADVKAETNPTVKQWCDAVASYIEQEKIEQPIIIGHSMGGMMAEWIAAEHPKLIYKILVVDALPCLSALYNPAFKGSETPDCAPMVKNFTSMDDAAFYQMQKKSIPSMLADSTKQETVIQWSVKSDRKTLALIYCQLMNTDLREKITSVNCPALILLEPSFAAIKPAIEEQYKNMKTARLEYANQGLHFIMYDDVAWFNKQLKAFLN